MSLKISRRLFENYICAIAGILSMNPYFVWPTFMEGKLLYVVYVMYLISIIIMLHRGAKLRKNNLWGVIFLSVIFGITYLHSALGVGIITLLGGIALYLYLILFCCLKNDDQIEIFRIFVKLFVITLIPGLIYYVLELLGISLSIGTIYSQNQIDYANSNEFMITKSTGYYKLYVGAVLRVNANTRFAGIYDEAGLVGTVAALCLVANQVNLKEDKWSRWLMLFLIISFSLAGYLLILIYYILKSIRQKQWKLPFVLAIILVGGYMLLTIKTNNALINTLQNRVQISGTSIMIVNNRETSQFNIGYSQFLNGNVIEKMFGFGRGASLANRYMNGSSTYKCYIYNYGYIGFGMMVVTIIYLYRKYLCKIWKKHWSQFLLIVLFIISIYQRPSIYFPYYFIILYGGAAFLSRNQSTENREVTVYASN